MAANVIALIMLSSFAVSSVNGDIPSRLFDVTKYGAVANGRTDDSLAFLRAWQDACAYRGKSGVWIPRGVYLVGSVTFSGPCNGPIAFLNKGTLRAPTEPSKFITDTWIGFRYINRLTVAGGGYLDGEGPAAWPYNDCNRNAGCRPLPVSLRLDFVTNSKVHHLRSVNSKNTHINLFACTNVNLTQLRITAPADSPNTDGIRIGSSNSIRISNSRISTGDDCISMVSGTRDVDISFVSCGPGHGISVGSLGKGPQNEYVLGVRVSNCSFAGTENGVRIKTWAPSQSSLASGITFEDIVMRYVKNPIVIDQQYCPHSNCMEGVSSAVQVENVVFRNIRGISQTQVAVNLLCSNIRPCKDIKLVDIDLSYMDRGGRAIAQCSNVLGAAYGLQIPAGCL
ncbi:pectin lyase-like superfamily protein [Striga asiatica]|uniref:Pectin lyase-like superfamily protein n=1 Tax=Striga asiatica TaxID=4170 RepID=A0A5A7RAK2_STRAF|nr:pectin lyase-like superfamily protein [Striga asiatica]